MSRKVLPFPTTRILVVSDFNCPYCFTLNEWIQSLGMSDRVRWVGIEHRSQLPETGTNSEEEVRTLKAEVLDVRRRAPELGPILQKRWINSRQALLLQNATEDEYPELAAQTRSRVFRSYWKGDLKLSDVDSLLNLFQKEGVSDIETEPEYLDELTRWWKLELDRIPCMLAPTGVAHMGLQDRSAVESFLNSAIHEGLDGPGCSVPTSDADPDANQ